MLTCEHCERSFEASRWRAVAYCSPDCRDAHNSELKRGEALRIIGRETGLNHCYDSDQQPAHTRLRYLSSRALFLALKDLGYVWRDGKWEK